MGGLGVGKFGKKAGGFAGKGAGKAQAKDEDDADGAQQSASAGKGKFGGGAGGFKKTGAKGGAKTPAKKKGSRWAGVKSAQPSAPMLEVGDGGVARYRLRYLRSEATENDGTGNETHKAYFNVEVSEGPTPEGTEVVVLNVINGKAKSSGLARVKAQTVAIAGHEDDETYDELDPDGELIDAMLGEANQFGEDGDPMAGRLVDTQVTRGKDTAKGDYYRQYDWAVVSDDEQDEKPAFGSE